MITGSFSAAVAALFAAEGLAPGGPLELTALPPLQQDTSPEFLAPTRRVPGPLRRALRLLDRLLRRSPRAGDLWILRGAVHAAARRWERARADLDCGIALAPGTSQAHVWRFAARYNALDRHHLHGPAMERFIALKADLDEAVALDAGNLEAYANRALLLHDLELGPAALADLDCVLALNPECLWARVERADVLSELKRYEEAMREFAFLRRRLPGRPWLLALRARARAKCGRDAQARRDLDRALAQAPRLTSGYMWRGELRRRQGDGAGALRDMSRALALAPRSSYARMWRAQIWLSLGRWKAASRDLARALRSSSRHMNLYTARAQAAFMQGDFRRAVADFDRAYPLNPRTAWVPPAGSRDRAQELMRALRAASRRHPRSYWARAFHGRMLIEERDDASVREGLAELTAAIGLDARRAWAYAWRGEAYRRLGESELARQDLNRAVRRAPRWGWPRAWRGALERDGGRLEAAVRDYAAAARLLPHDGGLRSELGKLRLRLGRDAGRGDLDAAAWRSYGMRGAPAS